jgi:hypothetical protein
MSDDLREFNGSFGPILIRRTQVSAAKVSPMPDGLPTGTEVLVQGKLFWVQAEYEAVRDWVRGT